MNALSLIFYFNASIFFIIALGAGLMFGRDPLSLFVLVGPPAAVGCLLFAFGLLIQMAIDKALEGDAEQEADYTFCAPKRKDNK